jgi:hypothetical protein
VEALGVIRAFQHETNYTVWADLTSKLNELETVVSNTPYYEQYREFARNLYRKIGESLGWDPKTGESHLQAMLRSLAVAKLGKLGDKNIAQQALVRHSKFEFHSMAD